MTDDLSKKSKRILVSFLQTLNSNGQLSASAFFKIFDMKICSILLYGCEVWATQKFDSIQRIQYYACKRFMNVSQNASNYVVITR